MDITDVQLACPHEYALGHRMAARNDSVVGCQVELLNLVRHERQVGAVVADALGPVLYGAGVNLGMFQGSAFEVLGLMHQGVDRGGWHGSQHLTQHFLGSGIATGEPVMDESYLFHSFFTY